MALTHPDKIEKLDYEAQLRALQIELVKLQRWVIDQGEQVVIVMEGRDAAGKGGTIDRFRQHLNPRQARVVDPLKQWKISPVDETALDRWDDYTAALTSMLEATDTDHAPWTGVNANRQKVGRLHAIRHVLHALPYAEKDTQVAVAPDPAIVGPAKTLLF